MKRVTVRQLALVLALSASGAAADGEFNYVPNAGYVPDATTAISVGRAVLIPVYGTKQIQSEEPFFARRQGDVWVVTGTLHCGAQACVGGTAEVKISSRTGQILHMMHGK